MTPSITKLTLGAIACLSFASLAGAGAGCGADHSKTAARTAAKADMNIVETAVAAGSFGTLVKAVQAAGLVETLSGPGPFTVFAPTDAAFAALPAGTLESLLADNAALTKVLTYHVVAGKVLASALPTTPMAKTVEGSSVKFSLEGGARINQANIVATDIMTSNGVIHVIDAVILPPSAPAGRS
jgi:uncharacterized surface protein with fasciclin (FAS1) repeats